MKRWVKLIISILLVTLTVHMTVGVTFTHCRHSGKIALGISNEMEKDGYSGIHRDCMEVFTEILADYIPSYENGQVFHNTVLPPVFGSIAVQNLSIVSFITRPIPDRSPAVLCLLGAIMLRR